MKKKYYIILNALIVNATIVAQITFPGEPTQAPIKHGVPPTLVHISN